MNQRTMLKEFFQLSSNSRIKLIPSLLLASLLSTSFSTFADDKLSLRYNDFYNRAKYNIAEEFQDLNVSFYLKTKRGEVCQINQIEMRKEEHFEIIAIPETNQLMIPMDSTLRKVNPDIFIHYQSPNNLSCDMSIEVEAKDNHITKINGQTLDSLTKQFSSLYQELGGMMSSWFVPEATGIIISFDQPTFIDSQQGKVIETKENKLYLSLGQLEDDSLIFSQASVKVTPWFSTK
ncbi:DUF2987 domain-containing protein [Vibrio sp. SS-MA-C1-2]|uniref:DUF2987 domain-containing protein n=1 Tax=Vibrio sp. SS-MA-C1-2 TaxID=2908646 RepID=UPI001F188645|nr:DUF2987 domain-containing protein [Vibrio sp. SS-MA-C1-2]UJF18119.1 DUF2987 domain-containing protein [Vibrio sp. SS-MA-C1-2]